MSSLRILYLGPQSGTCLDRANAYRRLGHEVLHVDPRQMLPNTPWVDRLIWRVGGGLFEPWVRRGLQATLNAQKFDLCHVDNGELISPSIVAMLRIYAPRVINYSIDDPLGRRDGRRFSAYRKALAQYDLAVVMREQNIEEAEALGAKNVLRVFMSADEVAHTPRDLTSDDHSRWNCDVLFIGTWMPERGQFLLELVQRGVPLTIRGPHWHKAPEWPMLKDLWKGGWIAGDDYAKAIQCARINLGLLSKGNRDRHTTRSLEIPALGGLLCAERSDEHLAMYQDGVEAVFWSNAAECAEACRYLLDNEEERLRVAALGRTRSRKNGYLNEQVLAHILAATTLKPRSK